MSFRDVVEPVRIYCSGQETFALYIMSLGAWYCECCGKKAAKRMAQEVLAL